MSLKGILIPARLLAKRERRRLYICIKVKSGQSSVDKGYSLELQAGMKIQSEPEDPYTR
jgi:hypothetical protein